MVQWLTHHESIAGGTCSIPGWGTKVLQAAQCSQKTKKRRAFGSYWLYTWDEEAEFYSKQRVAQLLLTAGGGHSYKKTLQKMFGKSLVLYYGKKSW